MKGLTFFAWLPVISAAVLGLFYVSSEVQKIEETLRQEQAAIVKHQRTIHILKAEWSYLNQPARLAELSRRHLGLAPMGVDQVVTFDALPLRQRRTADQPDASGTRTE